MPAFDKFCHFLLIVTKLVSLYLSFFEFDVTQIHDSDVDCFEDRHHQPQKSFLVSTYSQTADSLFQLQFEKEARFPIARFPTQTFVICSIQGPPWMYIRRC